LGLLNKVVVTGAQIQDGVGALLLLDECLGEYDRLAVLLGDKAYWRERLNEWLVKWTDWAILIIQAKAGQKGFEVQPWRWIVERTFAWLGKFRRLSKDYEFLTQTSEAVIYACMTRLTVARLAKF
jgi:putative transposase